MSAVEIVQLVLVTLAAVALGYIWTVWMARKRHGEVWFGRNAADARTSVPTLFARIPDVVGAMFLAFDVVATKKIGENMYRPLILARDDDTMRVRESADFGEPIGKRSKVALADFPGRFDRVGRGCYLELEFDWLCWHMHETELDCAGVQVSVIDERDRETVVATGRLTLSEARSLLGDDLSLPPMPAQGDEN